MSQIDSLLITDNTIRLFEIKNMSGEYTYEDDALRSESGLVYTSPVVQIKKSSSLIHNLIRKNGLRFEVISHIVFMNPHFYIYNLPKNKVFIFPYKIKEHLSALNTTNFSLGNKQKQLIELLMKHHQENYRSNELPTYEYLDLKKGIYCPECFSFEHTVQRLYITCECGYKDNIDDTLERCIKEFRILFPESKLTVPGIYDWCGGQVNRVKIQAYLKNNYTLRGSNRGSYYVKD